ncbi:MAG: energy transducer TonB [Tepidisphaeraceae bacterium]
MIQSVTEFDQANEAETREQCDLDGRLTNEAEGKEPEQMSPAEQLVDWEAESTGGESDVRRTASRRLQRKVFSFAFVASVSAHAMTVGTLYLVTRPTRTAPQLILAMPAASEAVNSEEIESTDQTEFPLASKLPPFQPIVQPDIPPVLAQRDPVENPTSDSWNIPVSPLVLDAPGNTRDVEQPLERSSADDAIPHIRRLPPLRKQSALLTPIIAAQPTSAAPIPARAPAIRTSARNRRGAKNGYDDRGLPIPDYPPESRRRGEQGLVLLDVEVKADGTPGAITVVKDPGFPRLVDAAIEASREAAFEPAKVDGVPVIAHIRIPFRFVLQ